MRSARVVLNWHDSFHPNDVQSTLGFHTAATFPERNRTTSLPFDEHSGTDEETIHCAQTVRLSRYRNAREGASCALNTINILGYFPVIGLIPCAARLIVPLRNKDHVMWLEPEDVRNSHFTRGAIEGMGLGIAYLIPDIIATVKRFAK